MAVEDPRSVLRRYGLRPKRSWGQNFMVNLALAERIADAVADANVSHAIEIGAGAGTLTAALAAKISSVTAIERDPELAALLREELPRLGANVQIAEVDAVSFDYLAAASGGPTAVVGNLPYNLTGRLIRRIIEARSALTVAVVMVQIEVAQRILAPAGSATYGVLTVMCKAWMSPSILWRVSPGSFFPRPKVSSAVVRLEPRRVPLVGDLGEEAFAAVVHAAFSSRRKTLRNTLGSVFDRESVAEALDAEGIDPSLRAETLTVEQLASLARRLVRHEAPRDRRDRPRTRSDLDEA